MDLVLDVVSIPALSMSGSISSHGEEFGTADAIRHIHDKLKANRIMIVSSDLITDVQVICIRLRKGVSSGGDIYKVKSFLCRICPRLINPYIMQHPINCRFDI